MTFRYLVAWRRSTAHPWRPHGLYRHPKMAHNSARSLRLAGYAAHVRVVPMPGASVPK